MQQLRIYSFTIYEFINNIAEMHFFGKIRLDKFGTHDGSGVEISVSAVWFLSLSK